MTKWMAVAVLALSLSTGCAGTFGAHSKPKAGAPARTCDPSYASAVYLTGVAVAVVGMAIAIDSDSDPMTVESSQREMPGLGVVAGGATAGAIWSAYSAGKCRGTISRAESH